MDGIVVSDNEQGNKLHSAKTGRFVGKNGEEGEMDFDERNSLLRNVIKTGISNGLFGNRIANTYNNADDAKKEDLITAIAAQLEHKSDLRRKEMEERDTRDVGSYIPASKIDTQGLDSYERKTALLQDTRLSKSAILNATDDEITQLLEAQYLYDSKKKQVFEDPAITQLRNNPKANLDGIWQSPVGLEDYEQLKSSGRIDKKLYYFENNYDGDDKDAKIQSINDWCALGEQYISLIKTNNLDTSADEAIMEKFSNPDSPYSWKRKHKESSYNDEMSSSYNALQKTNQKYGAQTNKIMKNVFRMYGQDGLDIIADYTHGFVWANDPLREISYSSSGGSATGQKRSKQWLQNIQLATNVLNMSSYNDDIWLTRGSDFLGDKKFGIDFYSIKNLDDLVGMVFGDQGFVSSSASKINYTNQADPNASQFKNKTIIQHIYAPKGTHMLHTASLATSNYNSNNYNQDNTDYSTQNEFLIQRGYSYRITKAYKVNGKVHIDCEIILGSDSQKYDDKELAMIERMYVS